MPLTRAAFALDTTSRCERGAWGARAARIDPKLFGRGRVRLLTPPRPAARTLGLSADVKLFATTFVAGFLFVSILIG